MARLLVVTPFSTLGKSTVQEALEQPRPTCLQLGDRRRGSWLTMDLAAWLRPPEGQIDHRPGLLKPRSIGAV